MESLVYGGAFDTFSELHRAQYFCVPEGESVTGLEKIISQAEIREQCVSLGYEQSKKFNWQKTAQETLAVLEKATQ